MTDSISLVVCSNYTSRPVMRWMNEWAARLDYQLGCKFIDTYQIIPELLNQESQLHREEYDFRIIFFRFENCFAHEDGVLDFQTSKQFSENFVDAIEHMLTFSDKPVIVIEGASSIEDKTTDLESKLSAIRTQMFSRLSDISGVYCYSDEQVKYHYTSIDFLDNYSYPAALIPYTKEGYHAHAALAFRAISMFRRKPKKVIVLDCDNTLWKGVVGEDGVNGVEIDQNFLWFQEFLISLTEKGFLLCLCSKNIETDVFEAIGSKKLVMPLTREHLVAWRVNWQPKSVNIRELAEELNLSADSFILIDDNPIEINEVGTNLPDVKCLQFPAISEDIQAFAKNIWEFDVPNLSEVDKKRSQHYKLEFDRRVSAAKFSTFEEFLDSLNIEIDYQDFSDATVDRVSQMTRRTNQFNFSGVVLSPCDVKNLGRTEGSHCILVSVRDRFGDYGEVGCLIYSEKGGKAVLHNFLLSCRVLGKKLENRIWSWLQGQLRRRGHTSMMLRFKDTGRNQPAMDFVSSVVEDFDSRADYLSVQLEKSEHRIESII